MSHRYVFADSRRRSVSFTKTLGDVRAANRSREQLTKRSQLLFSLFYFGYSYKAEVTAAPSISAAADKKRVARLKGIFTTATFRSVERVVIQHFTQQQEQAGVDVWRRRNGCAVRHPGFCSSRRMQLCFHCYPSSLRPSARQSHPALLSRTTTRNNLGVKLCASLQMDIDSLIEKVQPSLALHPGNSATMSWRRTMTVEMRRKKESLSRDTTEAF
ncbi:hypothetical protein C0Q70_04299 [Pomacea canaliculata]|uniref:Uncharacterized protein n=1 Tax=Pomacea canaliculata TaxID=400727 RepID=A0A2T7PV80_POMCA|nr:hypothetical protein C0Q70_04299 [Pomacea canaliculata]